MTRPSTTLGSNDQASMMEGRDGVDAMDAPGKVSNRPRGAWLVIQYREPSHLFATVCRKPPRARLREAKDAGVGT
jgi:hypothetical protein